MSQYNRQDHLYKKAKEEGYRSRAAYKLIELDSRFNLISAGGRVLDLGCWPGGWLQVAAQKVGPGGLVVGIDLVAIESLPEFSCLSFIHGDARDEVNIEQLKAKAVGGYDVVLSDMSPKLSGIKEADQAGSVACAELALWLAQQVLRSGGSVVMKLFKGNDSETFVRSLRPHFSKTSRVELDATRSTSNEFYVVGLGFKASSTLPPK